GTGQGRGGGRRQRRGGRGARCTGGGRGRAPPRLALGGDARQARGAGTVAFACRPGAAQAPLRGQQRRVGRIVRARGVVHQARLQRAVQVVFLQQRQQAQPVGGAAHRASTVVELRLALLEEGAGTLAH